MFHELYNAVENVGVSRPVGRMGEFRLLLALTAAPFPGKTSWLGLSAWALCQGLGFVAPEFTGAWSIWTGSDIIAGICDVVLVRFPCCFGGDAIVSLEALPFESWGVDSFRRRLCFDRWESAIIAAEERSSFESGEPVSSLPFARFLREAWFAALLVSTAWMASAAGVWDAGTTSVAPCLVTFARFWRNFLINSSRDKLKS